MLPDEVFALCFLTSEASQMEEGVSKISPMVSFDDGKFSKCSGGAIISQNCNFEEYMEFIIFYRKFYIKNKKIQYPGKTREKKIPICCQMKSLHFAF